MNKSQLDSLIFNNDIIVETFQKQYMAAEQKAEKELSKRTLAFQNTIIDVIANDCREKNGALHSIIMDILNEEFKVILSNRYIRFYFKKGENLQAIAQINSETNFQMDGKNTYTHKLTPERSISISEGNNDNFIDFKIFSCFVEFFNSNLDTIKEFATCEKEIYKDSNRIAGVISKTNQESKDAKDAFEKASVMNLIKVGATIKIASIGYEAFYGKRSRRMSGRGFYYTILRVDKITTLKVTVTFIREYLEDTIVKQYEQKTKKLDKASFNSLINYNSQEILKLKTA